MSFPAPIRDPDTFYGKYRGMARPRTSPQPEVPGLAARRIAATDVPTALAVPFASRDSTSVVTDELKCAL